MQVEMKRDSVTDICSSDKVIFRLQYDAVGCR